MKQEKRILALVLALVLALPNPVYTAEDSALIAEAEAVIGQEGQESPEEEPVEAPAGAPSEEFGEELIAASDEGFDEELPEDLVETPGDGSYEELTEVSMEVSDEGFSEELPEAVWEDLIEDPSVETDGEYMEGAEELLSESAVELSTYYRTEYVDSNGNLMEPVDCNDIIEVFGFDQNLMNGHNHMNWYVMDRDSFDLYGPLVVKGDMNMIMYSGCRLILRKGLYICENSSLTIWNHEATDSPGLIQVQYNYDKKGPGITGWEGATSGKLIINGGAVDLHPTEGYAGIGSGPEGTGGLEEVIINGGEVKAYGGKNAAGIGGGSRNDHVPKVTITGGMVYAQGGDYGAGIGGGEDRSGSAVTITGGDVTAIGGKYAAGIGGGDEGGGGSVTITGIGAKVYAASGKYDSCAIGNGDDHDDKGLLVIGDGLEVRAGNDGANFERAFTAGERVNACHYRYCAQIQACPHECGRSYGDIRPDTHSSICDNCRMVFPDEAHVWTDGQSPCSLCDYKGYKVSFDADGGNGSMEDVYVIPGTDYPLPACVFDYPGASFIGWKTGDKTLQKDDTYKINEDTTFTALWDMPVVPYIDATGADQDSVVCRPVTIGMANKDLDSGWYALTQDADFSESIRICGEVNLILCDGKTLNASDGIWVRENAHLTIWAQSTGKNMGRLVATGGKNKAGIGGSNGETAGKITINGGNIEAKAGTYASAIGNGNDGGYRDITINGGKVSATPGGESVQAGIGGSYRNKPYGTVTITGGNVTATGCRWQGIGDGHLLGDVVISGGTVTASTIAYESGIQGNHVTISGGSVTSNSLHDNPGITGNMVTINDGTVKSYGGEEGGAGISGEVTITGGYVEAKGGTGRTFGKRFGGAGIGGNNEQGNKSITITGGTVYATGGGSSAGIGSGMNAQCTENITIGGNAFVTANGGTQELFGGAGIGGGASTKNATLSAADLEATVTIKDTAIVYATGGGTEGYGAAGIGGGYAGNASKGSVNISGNAMVEATGGSKGAGIGGGAEEYMIGGEGANVSITDKAVVIAKSGSTKSSAIGHGGTDSHDGSLTIGDYLKVQAGNDGANYERVFPAAERAARCQDRSSVRIEPCAHPEDAITISGDGFYHTWHCEYCGFEREERHNTSGEGGACSVCGYLGKDAVVHYVLADGVTDRTATKWQTVSQTMSTGWYVAVDRTHPENKTITFDDTLQISGKVNLILYDGVTLYANDGIFIPEGSTLTIWAQSGHSGKLVAAPESGPGIGGVHNTTGGRLIINGGRITAKGGSYAAGIGGGEGSDSGFSYIEINGDYTVVEATGGTSAAGIGGGQYNSRMGTIRINGGDVTAHGGNLGAGIGGGEDRAGGLIYLNGGIVKATGGRQGAGIGGGSEGIGGTIIVNGGTITATGGLYGGAGIGGGYKKNGGDITICGGDITANGKSGGAGIGGGGTTTNLSNDGSGGKITIKGGTIHAFGGEGGAGIGGGNKDNGGDVTILGGTVTAEGGPDGGSGIGGGRSGDSGTLIIRGGTVEATGKNGSAGIGAGRGNGGINLTISAGTVTATGTGYGPGIGGSYDEDTCGSVTISGGTVNAIGDVKAAGIGAGYEGNASGLTVNISDGEVNVTARGDSAGIGGGEEYGGSGGEGANVNITGGIVVIDSEHTAIGHGGSDSVMGNLTIDDRMKVYAGNNGTDYERNGKPFSAGERVAACQYRNDARIEICDHPDNTFHIDEYGHERYCDYCTEKFTKEEHDLDKENLNICTVCGYQGPLVEVKLKSNTGDNLSETEKAVPGTYYTLPGRLFDPPAYMEFDGWIVQQDDEEKILPEKEEIYVTNNTVILAHWKPVKVTVRFDPGEGTGEKESVEVDANTDYTLPGAYGFTDPEMMAFKGWQLPDGTRKSSDESIHVTEDITIQAVYLSEWQMLQEAVNEAKEGATILVDGAFAVNSDNRITALTADGTLTVPKSITIDLGGYILDQTNEGVTAVELENGVMLTLKDSVGGGGVTANYADVVVVHEGNNLVLEGGNIRGGKTGVVVDGGRFDMHGGKISGNIYGGGVLVKAGTFEMQHGEIRNNASVSKAGSAGMGGCGGGVYVEGKQSQFYMYGGSINRNAAAQGGGVYLNDGAFFAMEGGEISDNTASDKREDAQPGGGGVSLAGDSIFFMHSGSITGNTAEGSAGALGGGVVIGNGLFMMGGGEISGNTAKALTAYGGGVSISHGEGKFTMSGGKISGNNASTAAGGVYHFDGTFTVSGNPVIKDNTAGDTVNNAYLKNGEVITVNGNLSEASIGVSTESKPEEKEDSIPITNETGSSFAEFFISDDNSYEAIALHADAEQSEIVLKIHRFTVTSEAVSHCTITIQNELAYEDDMVFLTVIPEEGWFVEEVKYNYTDYYFPGGQERVSVATHLEGNEYSFKMPASDALVEVVLVGTSPTLTPPEKIEGLVYNGTEQNLIRAGSSDCGTMEYQVKLLDTAQPGDDAWSASLPVKQDQGTYYVWYRVKGDAPYGNSEPQCIPVTIGKAPLTLTANDVTIEYGSEPVHAGVTAVGLQNGETLQTAIGQGRLTYQFNYPYEGEQVGDAGEYAITPVFTPDPDNDDSLNYEVTCVSGKLTVKPMKVTVTAYDCMGADNPDVSKMKYETSGRWLAKDSEILNVHLELGAAQVNNGVKTYPIRVVYTNNANYDMTTQDGTYTVISSIRFNAVGYEGVYDGQPHGIKTEVEGAKVSYGESKDSVNLDASPQYRDAGTYEVFYEVKLNDNTVVQKGSKMVTITKKALTVIADDKNITYGEADPEFTYSAEGLVEGDALSCSLTRLPHGDDAGSYAISKSELNVTRDTLSVIDNYDVTFANGSLTIGKAPSVIEKAPEAKELTYTGKAQELVTAGETDDGELRYSLSQDGPFDKAIPTGTDTGSYTVYYQVQGDGNHNNSAVQGPIRVTIGKVAATVTLPSANELTYTGYDRQLVSGGKAEGGTLVYSLSPDGPLSEEIPTGIHAGDYDVYCKAVGDKNHSDSTVAGPIKVTIEKAASVITLAPKAKNLAYTGNEQPLVSEGRTNGGVVMYSLQEEGPFSEAVPTAVDVGVYPVYYKVTGDINHYDGAVGTVEAGIKKAQAKVTAPTADRLTYNGRAQELVKAGTTNAGVMTYSLKEEGPYSETIPSATDAGEYNVYYRVESDSNYEEIVPGSINVTIWKAEPVVTAPTAAQNLVYTGKPQTLAEGGSVEGGTFAYSPDNQIWSGEVPKGTDAGTYTVYYRVQGDKNHKDVAAKQLNTSIRKAASVIEKAPEGGNLTYNGKAQKLVTEGIATGGSMRYSIDNNSNIWSTTVPSVTDAGTYTVFYQTVGDENHTDASVESITVTISKAVIRIAAKDKIGPQPTDASGLEYDISGDLVEADEPGLAVTLSLGEEKKVEGLTTYPINVSYTPNSNYEINVKPGTYTVSGNLVYTVGGYYGEYDGAEHSIWIERTNGNPAIYFSATPIRTREELAQFIAEGRDSSFSATDAGSYTGFYAIVNGSEFISGSKEVVITPKKVTVTTAGGSKAYDGTALRAAGAKIEGLEYEDTAEIIPTGSQTEVGSSKNTYRIFWGNHTKKSNYAVTENLGTLSVTTNDNKITIRAAGRSKIYDGKALTDSSVTVSGLPDGFSVEAEAVGTQTDAGSSENVVSDGYVIRNTKGEDKTDNFTNISTVSSALTVEPKPITITADSASSPYGETLKNLTWKVDQDLVAGDDLGVIVSTTATDASNAGNYPISVGWNENPNYTATLGDGTYTVSPRSVTVTAADQTVAQGGSIDTGVGKAHLSGQVGGHTLRAVKLTPSSTAPATSTGEITPSGAVITDQAGNDVTANYAITYVPGKLTVTGEPEEGKKLSMGEDGTAFGKGADEAALEAAIAALTSDEDPKGTSFTPLCLQAKKATESSIKVAWKKVKGAKKYVVYANACGKDKKLQKVKTTTGKSFKLKKLNGKKLKKGTYYKFMVAAFDQDNKVITVSKILHAATAGGKVDNPGGVTTEKQEKATKLKKDKTYKLGAKALPASTGLKVKKHRGIKYETSNPNIATVSKRGVIKAKKKGSCYVYAYAQNGIYVRIKVTVQ